MTAERQILEQALEHCDSHAQALKKHLKIWSRKRR